MTSGPGPDAVDTRLVFRVYAWIAIVGGTLVYAWPRRLLPGSALTDLLPLAPYAIARALAAVIVFSGCCAAAFARLDDPVARRRMLYRFAVAHLVFGAMFWIQWYAILQNFLPATVGVTPLAVGGILWHLAYTAPALPAFGDGLVHHLERSSRDTERLRSEYEAQIRRAAQREERARLARELHDAVKQQLFVIQTAAATAQARFDPDPDGARAALERVRTATREATTEMEALLEQLQAAPLENAGLTLALKKQAEALGFRTGADVRLEATALPPNDSMPPGSQQAIFRVAQEALSNVARHARAQHVHVSLSSSGRDVALEIRDDGAGFDAEAESEGMGRRSMQARAEEVGGRLQIASEPGRGTTVRFSVPVEPLEQPRYGRRALAWGAFTVAWGALALTGSPATRPLRIGVLVIVAISTVRSLVAWARMRPSPRRLFGMQPRRGAGR